VFVKALMTSGDIYATVTPAGIREVWRKLIHSAAQSPAGPYQPCLLCSSLSSHAGRGNWPLGRWAYFDLASLQ
jgi:hypothetical protein